MPGFAPPLRSNATPARTGPAVPGRRAPAQAPLPDHARRSPALPRRAEPVAGYAEARADCLQRAAARPAASNGTAPIQRYKRVGNARVSNNGNLCLVGPRELYAADAQLAQANALHGAVAFERLEQLPPKAVREDVNDGLHRVKISLKPNFAMNNMNFTTNAHGQVSSLTPQEITEDFDYRNDPENRGGDFNAENARNYKQRVKRAKGPLLPSDCGITSRVVAGHMNDPEEGASTVMQPGSIYQITSGHDAREWAYHLAAVVMTDGGDHVTLENAAAKASEQYGKYALDKGWWFDMFGTKKRQSFAWKYRHDLPEGELDRIHPPPPPVVVPVAPVAGLAPVAGPAGGGGFFANLMSGLSRLNPWGS